MSSRTRTAGRTTLLVLATGLAAGFLSGLFGVGGGLIIVPALMTLLGMDQRRAAATSLAAIVVTAAVGTATYAARGQVSLLAFVLVGLGSLAGAHLGTWLLRRLPHRVLPWIFIGFTLAVIVSQQLRVRVGGGSVIVPGLELVVGVGDLMARGTSLLVMVPTSLSGTWSNARHGVVDLRAGLLVGSAAVLATPLGSLVAARISPATGNLLFSGFLVCVVLTMLSRERARRRRRTHGGDPH